MFWQRSFGPFEPSKTVKLIRSLRALGCRHVRPTKKGTWLECSVPMRNFENVLQVVKQAKTP